MEPVVVPLIALGVVFLGFLAYFFAAKRNFFRRPAPKPESRPPTTPMPAVSLSIDSESRKDLSTVVRSELELMGPGELPRDAIAELEEREEAIRRAKGQFY